MNLEAVILAGGAGTRLREVLPDRPKPMALVRGTPFLSWLLEDLERQGIARAIIATGYRAEQIEEHFGKRFGTMELCYAREGGPLGTGGALRHALERVSTSNFLAMNGDSIMALDFRAMQQFHRDCTAELTIALKSVSETSRYGCVRTAGERVIAFGEKGGAAGRHRGLINAGVYLGETRLFEGRGLPESFSFEHDFLAQKAAEMKIAGYVTPGFFIDIGIPEDFARAQVESYFSTPRLTFS